VVGFHLKLRVCLNHRWIAMSAFRVQVPLADWVGSFLMVVRCSPHSVISLLISSNVHLPDRSRPRVLDSHDPRNGASSSTAYSHS
jgi:hypothetical protein